MGGEERKARRPVRRHAPVLPWGMPVKPARELSPASQEAEERLEQSLRPATFDEYVGQAEDRRERPGLRRGRAQARRGARPRAPLRAAGAGQDLAGPHPRPRAGRGPARDERPGAGEEGRPGRPAHRAGPARHPLHRRDPPALPRRRGGAVPGHGGLPLRRGAGRGPGRPDHGDEAGAVHAGGRHHPHRPARQPAARPVPHPGAARLLRRGRARRRSRCGPRGSWPCRSTRTAPRSWPAAPAARRASPSGSCSGRATSPRSRGTGASPEPSSTAPCSGWRWTPAASTPWTGASWPP